MGLTNEQENLLYKLIDYLDIPRTMIEMPQRMPQRSIFLRGAVSEIPPEEYYEKLMKFPEDLRQELLKQGIARVSVEFEIYKLGDGEVGEGGVSLVSPGPMCADLETRASGQ